MILQYLSFSISIAFISFIIGMILTTLIRNSKLYQGKLSNLNFVKSETVNRLLGVGVIKWIVKNTFFKFLNPTLKVERKMNLSDLKEIRNAMTKAEIDHLFAFAFVMLFVIYALLTQKYLFALTLMVINTLMNLCPSLLQQQNKRRLDLLMGRFAVS
jgi:ABC-type protease/lipase transport system fused ATPase/permease subunit